MLDDRLNARVKWIIKWISKWLLVPLVLGVYLLSPDLRNRGPWVYVWLAAYVVYLAVLEVFSWTRKFYETPTFRMIRIQVMVFLGSALIFLTGGEKSYFWFIYLWSLFASATHFRRTANLVVSGQVALLYLLSSVAAEGLGLVNWVLLLVNLAIILVLAVAFQYLRATESELEYFKALEQIQQDVDTAIDLQEVLDKILARAVALVRARDGTLMLADEKGELRFRARFGGTLPSGKVERTFKPGEGVAGWVAQNRQPYICYDTKTDKRFVPIVSGSVPIRSLVSVPILSHGAVLGVINVDYPEAKHF